MNDDGRNDDVPKDDDDGSRGGWTDVPPDPSPRIIPGTEGDTSGVRHRLELQAHLATSLRDAARARRQDRDVSVISITAAKGQVRFTDAAGSTRVETWIQDESGWRPEA
ncbi:hypothetical protein [Arthrobacter monumenti]